MTAQWILNDIWNEGYEDGRQGPEAYWMVYPIGSDEHYAYTEGFMAGQRAKARIEGKVAA